MRIEVRGGAIRCFSAPHRHLQLEHLVHLVVLVAQVDKDTLNNTEQVLEGWQRLEVLLRWGA